jgi:glycosyltransferase XagB
VTLVALVGGTPVSAMLWPLAFVLPFAGTVPALGRSTVLTAYVTAGAMWSVVGLTALATMVAGHRRGFGWGLAALLPGYLLMHAVAAWRGVRQLVHEPFTWEKTSHHATDTTDVTTGR